MPAHWRRLVPTQGAVLSTAAADGYPVAAASAHSVPPNLEPRTPVAAASSPAAAGVRPVSAISDRSWQTLREALTHAAEGRILAARALLEPAAAASGLSEAAFLAKLESSVQPEAAPDNTSGDGKPAAPTEGHASSQSPFHAVAAAASEARVATTAQQPAARQRDHGVRHHSCPLSTEQLARLLALPAEADWLREGLRQFHDREGYIYARDDDLKVSYRHLKGVVDHGPCSRYATSDVRHVGSSFCFSQAFAAARAGFTAGRRMNTRMPGLAQSVQC